VVRTVKARAVLEKDEPTIELEGPANDVSAVARELGSSIPTLEGRAGDQPMKWRFSGASGLSTLLTVRAAGDRAGVTIKFEGCP